MTASLNLLKCAKLNTIEHCYCKLLYEKYLLFTSHRETWSSRRFCKTPPHVSAHIVSFVVALVVKAFLDVIVVACIFP